MEHPQVTFAYLVARIREAYPRFSYIHVVEPRAHGNVDRTPLAGESNDFLRAIWKGPNSLENGSIYLAAGGYKAETALEDADRDEPVVFGRYFTSNVRFPAVPSEPSQANMAPQPDLPARVKKGIPFAPYDRDAFYNAGSPEGYITHPFADPESEALYNEKKRERDGVKSKDST